MASHKPTFYEQVAEVKLLFVLHRAFCLLLVRLRGMLLSNHVCREPQPQTNSIRM